MARAADLEEKPRRAGRQGKLPWLLGLLVVAGGAYFATAPLRRDASIRADLLRKQVDAEEKRQDEEKELRRKRQERLQLLEKLASSPEDPDLLLRTAALYGQDRRYEDAAFLLQEARRLRPDDSEPYRALMETYVSQSQFDRAYDYAFEGLKRAPKDVELILGTVHLDSLVGWNSHARETVDRLKGTPDGDLPRVRVASALIYRQVTDARHSQEDLRAALARDPKNDTVWALLSSVEWENGREKEAEAAILKALEIKPEAPDYLLHLGEIYLRHRNPADTEKARQLADRALRSDPGNRNAFFALAQALLQQGKTDEARDMLERLLERYPDHAQAGFELAKIYTQTGKREEARRLLARYNADMQISNEIKSLTLKVGMLPRNAKAHVDLGKVYNDTGSPEKAALVLRRALQLEPGSQAARAELARALTRLGRSGEYGELAAHPEWHVSPETDSGTAGASPATDPALPGAPAPPAR